MKTQSPWKSLGLLAGCLVALGAGSWWRDRIEMGPQAGESVIQATLGAPDESSGLVASLNAPVEGREAELFYQVLDMIEQYYVEPQSDPQKLAAGAVRGMIAHLADPYAMFMDKDQFAAYNRMLKGRGEGIGAELRLTYDDAALAKYRDLRRRVTEARRAGKEPPKEEFDVETLMPQLQVAAVLDGSSAAEAGMQQGDVIEKVGEQWVWSSRLTKELEALRDELQDPKTTEQRITEIRKTFDDRSENSIMPARALERLLAGKAGEELVVWRGAEGLKSAKLAKGETDIKPVIEGKEGIRINFIEGASSELASRVSKDGTLTLDLRNTPSGDVEQLQEVLRALLPAGNYGTLRNARLQKNSPFKVEGTGQKEWKFKLVTDKFTRGHVAILANALILSGQVTEVVGPKPAPTATLETLVKLQDGSGFLLPTGTYSTEVKA